MNRTWALLIVAGFLPMACGGNGSGPGDPGTARDQGPVPDTFDPGVGTDVADTPPETTGDVGTTFPAEFDLLLKVLTPGGTGYAATATGDIAIAGIVLGPVEKVTWASSQGKQGDALLSGTSWRIENPELQPGDNLIEITATGADMTASDKVLITLNPKFHFPGSLKVNPPALISGQPQKLYVTLSLGPSASQITGQPTLKLVNPDKQSEDSLGFMWDEGMAGNSGDEIQEDGVFTQQVIVPPGLTGRMWLRAEVQYGQRGVGLSPPVDLDIVSPVTTEVCEQHRDSLSGAREAYDKALAEGGIAAAREAAAQYLGNDPLAAEVGDPLDSGGIWVRWNDGLLGALNVWEPGTRGGATAGTDGDLSTIETALSSLDLVVGRKALALSPYASEFAPYDEAKDLGLILPNMDCPAFKYDWMEGPEGATTRRFRRMNQYGVVAVATHAAVYFESLSEQAKLDYGWSSMGGQEVLWTGEPVDCSSLLQAEAECQDNSDCPPATECYVTQALYQGGTAQITGICHDYNQVDLVRGNLVMGESTFGITPGFIEKYASLEPYPNSLVHLGGCHSMETGSLTAALLASGAGAVSGFKGVVSNQFAHGVSTAYLDEILVAGKTVGDAFTPGLEDPAHPGSKFRMWGNPDLYVDATDLLNPHFETGDLTGWDRDGDGRVIGQLGKAVPTAGSFMAIISTGLGYTVQTGSIEQTFCIPDGATTFAFDWKYYSEEFHEWCGSQYQDTFRARFVDVLGQEHTPVNLAVDDLCAAGDCNGCGTEYVGLTPSDVQFDQGDCHVTEWQHVEFPIAAIPSPVTLSFFCTDKGDSIYDTAVLVDHVRIY